MGTAIRLLGAFWTAPNTVIGLVLGLLGLPFGVRPRLAEGALVFARYPFGHGALVLGQVMLLVADSLDVRCLTYAARARRRIDPACAAETVRLGDHERAHVLQYLAFGPLFLPLYLLCGGISARNPFERAADRYALTGRGWWPFSRKVR